MPAVDTNLFPKVLLTEVASASTPASGSQAVYIDSADHKIKRKDSSGSVTIIEGGSGGGGGSLTTASAHLGSDVTMTSANTYYDGPSVSLAAGTWLIIATIIVTAGSSTASITAKIWDGTTTAVSAESPTPFGTFPVAITLAYIVTPGSTTTYKVSAAANNTGCVISAAAGHNAAGNTASSIVAVKVA